MAHSSKCYSEKHSQGMDSPAVICDNKTLSVSCRKQPYLLMEDWMFVASEEATAGSVIAKQLLIWPHSRGSSHCFFCFTVPYLRGSYC